MKFCNIKFRHPFKSVKKNISIWV